MPGLKSRLAARALLVGTWVKTPSPMLCEVLAASALDCLAIDAEHGPFDAGTLHACVGAAGGDRCLVRVPHAGDILQALDAGAAGVIVPHVRTAEEAAAAVKAAHYGPGGRGYVGASRAAGWKGAAMPANLARSATRTVVIAQIEDADALPHVAAIAATDGLDAVFVGRIDLTVSLGHDDPDHPQVVAAVAAVVGACHAAGRPVGMFLSRIADVPAWRAQGVTLFLLGSDHGFLIEGADALAEAVRG